MNEASNEGTFFGGIDTGPEPWGSGGGADADLLLVPTERHVEIQLAARERLGAKGLRVATFRAFSQEMLGIVRPALRPTSRELCAWLARVALDEIRPAGLGSPTEPAERARLAATVDRAIGVVRRRGVSAEALSVADAAEDRAFGALLAHIDARLVALARFDARGAGHLLAHALRDEGARALARPLVPRRVTVTGVLAWTAEGLAFVEALRGLGALVRVVLPALDGPDGDPIGPVAELLERRWAALDDAPELLWSPSSGPFASTSELVDAKGPEAEARAVVAAVRRALAEGAPPERVAVVVPSLDEATLEPLRNAFEEAALPFSEPRGRSPLRSPEARVITLLLALAEGPITRDQLIELLRAPGLHAGHWVERAGEGEAITRATRLAHRLRELPVRSDPSGALFVEALAARLRERGAEHGEEGTSDVWMVRALERIVESVQTLRGEATRKERASRLAVLCDRLELGRPSAAELRAAIGAEKGGFGAHALEALGEGAAAVRVARGALDALVEAVAVAGNAGLPCSAGELLAELESTIEGFPLTSPGARVGSVRIARAGDLAALSHELVVVTGLDGAAPSADGGAALGDADERAFTAGFDPASRVRRENERYAELAWVMARARRVVLTRAPASAAEELGEPHPAVRVALRRDDVSRRSEPASRLSPEASVTSRAGARLVALARGSAAEASVRARVEIERARLAFFLDPKAESGLHTGRVTFGSAEEEAHLRALVGGDLPTRTIAATAIERAAGCAFAAFASRALRVRRIEDVAEAATARDRGNLVHRALRALFEALQDRLSSNDPSTLLREARVIAERVLGDDASGAETQPALRREAIRQAVDETLCVFAWSLSEETSTPFALAEQRFGPRGAWPSLELHGDGPSVFVDGQIDRIDRTTDGRRVAILDYKTGKAPRRADQGHTLFQLPLYAEAAVRALGEPEELLMYYVAVRTGGAVAVSPEKESDRRLPKGEREDALGAARAAVVRLWSGDVAPRPLRLSMCTYCDARDVCRRPAVMPEEADAD